MLFTKEQILAFLKKLRNYLTLMYSLVIISKHRGKAQLGSSFCRVSWRHLSWITFQTMIPDLIDTGRNIRAAVSPKFVRKKSNSDKCLWQDLIIQNFSCQLCFPRFGILLPSVYEVCTVRSVKRNKYLPHFLI